MVAPLYHRPHRLLLDNNGTKPRSSFTNEANFDTNMVIILAALLCALICALGLNSIVRCALRCSRRFAFETPDETAARLAATGLKKSALRQIPVAVYGFEMDLKATDCPICLDTWLLSHSSCPTCRQSLLEPAVTCSEAAPVVMETGIRQHGNSSGGHADVLVADEVG
ncbi:hypothetical protein V6Z11_D06G220900 [Gossypium hirsutum]